MSEIHTGMKNPVLRYLLQAFNYTIFMAFIWYFATSPSVTVIEADKAMITVAIHIYKLGLHVSWGVHFRWWSMGVLILFCTVKVLGF